MVMQGTIHRLKQRPDHERHAIALLTATAVVIILFLAWSYVFFRGLHVTVAEQQQAAQTAAAAASAQPVVPSADSTTNSNFDQGTTGQ